MLPTGPSRPMENGETKLVRRQMEVLADRLDWRKPARVLLDSLAHLETGRVKPELRNHRCQSGLHLLRRDRAGDIG